MLITSAAVAVTLAARKAGQRKLTVGSGVIAAVFGYTTAANVVERPDGVKIAALFIAAILIVSLLSRLRRAFELRVTDVTLDDVATRFVRDCARRTILLVPNEPDQRDASEYSEKLRQVVCDNDLSVEQDVIFVEVTVTDPSDFATSVQVHGEVLHGRYRLLTLQASSVPNALAALAMTTRDQTHRRPHIYFEWTEGNPVVNFLRFLLIGVGEVAPVTREVLRRDPDRRPHVHVG